MISEETLRTISDIFIGDMAGFYSYKTGSKLVSFFNQYFGTKDVYANPFPSRWKYVYDKINTLIAYNDADSFFSVILSNDYLIKDLSISEVEAAEKSEIILQEFNRILAQDKYKITHLGKEFHLIEENKDLVFIGEGGFANVYKQLSTGLIVKKLKDSYLTDKSIRSRFKREFNITQSLKDMNGIISVYSFDENSYQYTMEEAETTLDKFVSNNPLSDKIKETIIRQILTIVSEVHKRNIIHRDLSPNNIFILSGQLKIADFGLGKDLNVLTSHQTMYTNAVGQYNYCAPEQFMMLKEADKRSDVYSLGRIINFVMTGQPKNSHHIHGNIAQKATNENTVYRYSDASKLLMHFEKSVKYHNDTANKEKVKAKIKANQYDIDVENYIFDLTPEQISKGLLTKEAGFDTALFKFMKQNEEHAQHVIQSIEQSFREVCYGSFEANDVFAYFANDVLNSEFSFVVKEIAATILGYVAWEIERFCAQRLIQDLKNNGIEPMLEDIISP